MGVHIAITGDKTKDLEAATKALGERWAGAAAAQAETLGGQIEQLHRQFDDLERSVGGFIATICDSAMARAMATAIPASARQVSFDLKVNFINAARPGERLRATARVLHAGRSTGVAEARVEGPGRTLIATATGSFSISTEGDS